MKKFTIVLVRNFVGMIFIVFIIVYFLFNALTNNFISTEARRELESGIYDIENMTYNLSVFSSTGSTPITPGVLDLDDFFLLLGQTRSLRQLMMNADGIIISEYNEVISPNLNQFNESIAAQVMFLANYYIANRDSFESDAMIRVVGENSTYYLMATSFMETYFMPSFTILLYTDVTSAMMFMGNINMTLGILLFAMGVLSVLISVFMSSKVQKAILRLCSYAEVIGQGKFNEKVETFAYKEFNDLAQSMNAMSTVLETSENNQKQFFQNVSHELRTPLISIQGYAEGIFEDVLDGLHTFHSDKAHQSCKHTGTLLDIQLNCNVHGCHPRRACGCPNSTQCTLGRSTHTRRCRRIRSIKFKP